jgi:hypothetical protein
MTPKQKAPQRRQQQIAYAELIEWAERREHQIDEALALLEPVADWIKQCPHVQEWLDYVESARKVATVTQKDKNRYTAALERLQTVSRTHRGVRQLGQAAIDQMVALDKEGVAGLAARTGIEDAASLPPLKPGYFAAVGAYELLCCWDRKPRASDRGDWHKLATILHGDDGNLYHYLRKVQSEQDRQDNAPV